MTTGSGNRAGPAALLLLAAGAAGVVGQGAYHTGVQRYVGVLVAAAAVLAVTVQPPTRRDAGLPPVLPAVALATWAILDTALLGVPAAGVGVALLLVGVVAVLLICRRLGQEDRDVLRLGVIWIGLAVALTGWLGVAGRVGSWSWEGQGIWRASSTLSYPNAAAALLVPVALVVLARLVEAPRSPLLAVAATGLLTGFAATMSRAGGLAFLVGLILLAVLCGPRATARAVLGPIAGALLALACLLPSMPAISPPRPMLALAGLSAGLTLAVIVPRLPRRAAVALALGGALVAGLALTAGGGGVLGDAARTVAAVRATLASPTRTGALDAAGRVVGEHPLTGVGPGHHLQWAGPDGVTRFLGYVHNEYVQVAVDLGLVGLTLLVVLLVAIARLLWIARTTAAGRARWAGAVAAATAFAVHSGFDFVWHLPAVLLTVMVLVGTALPTPVAPVVATDPVRLNERSPHENETVK